MVKKVLFPVGALLFLGLVLMFVGCNEANPPVTPRDAASLVLKFPVPQSASTPIANMVRSGAPKPKASLPLSYGTFEYKITSGSEAVTGSLDFTSGAVTMGTVSIPLPHNGTWMVSAEWLSYGSPRFVGADQVVIDGTTNLNLQMGDVNASCYYATIADPTSCANYYGDLFTFDSHYSAFSTIGGSVGDIQAIFDSNSGTEYLTAGAGSSAKFAYLGTGDWVNYEQIPAGTVYYADTETAKNTVMGAPVTMDYYDVYAVELSPTYHVWLQVTYFYYCPGGYVDYSFRVNSHGLNYMKYDSTTYGITYCQNLCYSCGGS